MLHCMSAGINRSGYICLQVSADAAFYDEDELVYEFGIVDAATKVGKLVAVSKAKSYSFEGLPVGNTTVYTCAADAQSAVGCTETVVTVLSPPEDFDVSSAISSVDPGELTQCALHT